MKLQPRRQFSVASQGYIRRLNYLAGVRALAAPGGTSVTVRSYFVIVALTNNVDADRGPLGIKPFIHIVNSFINYKGPLCRRHDPVVDSRT